MARDSVTAITNLGDWFGVSREHLETVFLDDHVGAVSAPANFAAIKAVTKRSGYGLARHGIPYIPAEATSFRHVKELFFE